MAEPVNPYRVPRADTPVESSGPVSPVSAKKKAVWLLIYLYPLVAAACFYSSWLVAWACLGHRPRPSLDDPKSISWIVDVVYFLSGVVLLTMPGFAPACFVSSFFCPWQFTRRRGIQWCVLALLYLLLCVAVIVTLRSDPGRVVDWWFD